MADLQKSVTRDIEFLETKDHKWYFRIAQQGQEYYLSDTYENRDECCQVGMDMMDLFHEKDPLVNEDKQPWE